MRLLLFILTNIAVCLTFSIAMAIGSAYWGGDGGEVAGVAIFALLVGMFGSLISLMLSKSIAKRATGAVVITGNEGETESWLVETVKSLASQEGLKCPEVAIYQGDPNAFATGATKNGALVAVSDSIIRLMPRRELRAVLAHEIGHVSNGDMVTMTLIQGVVNSVVIFLSTMFRRSVTERNKSGFLGYLVAIVLSLLLQFVLGIAATMIVCAFSREREFRADGLSARLTCNPGDMIAALTRLQGLSEGKNPLPDTVKAFGISSFTRGLLSTHPPIEKRIEALRNL